MGFANRTLPHFASGSCHSNTSDHHMITLDVIWMHILPPSCTFSLIVSSALFGLIFFPRENLLLFYFHIGMSLIIELSLKRLWFFCDSRLVSSSLIVVCHNLVWRGKGKPQLKKFEFEIRTPALKPVENDQKIKVVSLALWTQIIQFIPFSFSMLQFSLCPLSQPVPWGNALVIFGHWWS